MLCVSQFNYLMSLTDYIHEKITAEGPITFRDFMDIALYHPGDGYYTSQADKIGTEGDYYTSPWLTPLFGEMIGKQLEEMWKLTGEGEFHVVEYGAGTGAQCQAIMEYLRSNEKFYQHLTYWIIEKNTGKLSEAVTGNERVKIVEHIRDLAPFIGCVIANEVLDNFPVHQVVMEDKLMEVFVDYDNGFREILKPANEILNKYFEELEVTLPKGHHAEVNLQAIEWLKDISSALEKGFVLTIDYGFLSHELYSPARNRGTILCYHRHRINEEPFNFIGYQDITAHVNFSALILWGTRVGLDTCGYTDQSQFLLGLGLTNHLRNVEMKMMTDPATSREDILLLYKFLSEMGKKFKVLIQQKGMVNPLLTGMQFARLKNVGR